MFTHDALAGKHALICGASQGIGQACAQELARAGARVTLLARNTEKLATVLKGLPQQNSNLQHQAEVCDLSDPMAVRELTSRLPNDVDILVCNSGGPAPGPLAEATTEELSAAFQQHVLANTLLVQACLPHMKERHFGRIINIISTSVKAPLPGLGVSNTIRGAVANWAKTLANELGSSGITVNNVLPGFTKTERLEQIVQGKMRKSGKSREQVEAEMMQEVPLQRFASASEVAYACTFLASDLAAYISGINIPVDGGRTVCL
ncbi:MAG: SDR family oxidoreductase [Oligoflexus sp.]